MELLRRAANPWGQEVLLGISFDLMWAAVIVTAAFVLAHAVWAAARGRARRGQASEDATPTGTPHPAATGVPERVTRHAPGARAFHWSMSLAMFALLVTAFFPVVGWRFPWVTVHWLAGVLLLLAVTYHMVHASFWQDFQAMWMGPSDVVEAFGALRHGLTGRGPPPRKPGKYPFDHKLYHHGAAVVTLAAVVTGVLMMLRVQTPFWAPRPYFLADSTWGVVYVLHGLSGVALIGLVAAHVYFAVRPEKRWITWSMIRGWIDREHYLAHHDPTRWRVPAAEPLAPGAGVLEGARAPQVDDA